MGGSVHAPVLVYACTCMRGHLEAEESDAVVNCAPIPRLLCVCLLVVALLLRVRAGDCTVSV